MKDSFNTGGFKPKPAFGKAQSGKIDKTVQDDSIAKKAAASSADNTTQGDAVSIPQGEGFSAPALTALQLKHQASQGYQKRAEDFTAKFMASAPESLEDLKKNPELTAKVQQGITTETGITNNDRLTHDVMLTLTGMNSQA